MRILTVSQITFEQSLEQSFILLLPIPPKHISEYLRAYSWGLEQSISNSSTLSTSLSAIQIYSRSLPPSFSSQGLVCPSLLLSTLQVQKHSFFRPTSISLNLAAIMRQPTRMINRSQLMQHFWWKNLAAIWRAIEGIEKPYLNSLANYSKNWVLPLAMSSCTSVFIPYWELGLLAVSSLVMSVFFIKGEYYKFTTIYWMVKRIKIPNRSSRMGNGLVCQLFVII